MSGRPPIPRVSKEGPEPGQGHLSRQLLDEYVAGRATPLDLVETIARHLERDCCTGCREALARTSSATLVARAAERFRARAAELAREAEALPALLAELEPLGSSGVFLQAGTERRFHTAAFVTHQLALAWEALGADALQVAGEGLELAFLAALRLDPGRYGRLVVRRLEAECWLLRALLAVARGLPAAEAADSLDRAHRLVVQSLRSDRLIATYLLAQGRERLWAGRAEEARPFFAEATRLGPDAGDSGVAAEAVLARLEREAGRPEAAAVRLRAVATRWSRGPTGRTEWAAARELVVALVEACEPEEAAAFLAAWGGDVEAPSTARAELLLLRGLLFSRLRRPETARRFLEAAWRELLRRGQALDAALVAAERARIELADGRSDPLALPGLADELPELLMAGELAGVDREAIARFARALGRGTLTSSDVSAFEQTLLRAGPPRQDLRQAQGAGHAPAP